jgi:hypothetical protein
MSIKQVCSSPKADVAADMRRLPVRAKSGCEQPQRRRWIRGRQLWNICLTGASLRLDVRRPDDLPQLFGFSSYKSP